MSWNGFGWSLQVDGLRVGRQRQASMILRQKRVKVREEVIPEKIIISILKPQEQEGEA